MTAPWDDDGLGYEPIDGRCNDWTQLYPGDEGIDLYCMRDPDHDPELGHRGFGYVWDRLPGDGIWQVDE